MRDGDEAPALPEGEGLVVAVNPRSGPDDYDPAADIRAPPPPRRGAGDERRTTGVDELLGEAARSGRAKALGVAGGDGSVAAAAAVALEHGLPLAVIAAGTLNHFARDVGLETPQDTADAVVSGAAVRVDVADVNGTPFLNTASIGGYPEMVRRRDRLSHRMGKWLALTVAAAQVLRGHAGGARGQRAAAEGVDPLHRQLLLHAPRPLAGLAPATGGRAARRPVPARRRAVRPHPRGARPRCSASATARSYGHFQADEVRVVSRSGPQQVAYDGEMGEKAKEFVFRKRDPADRLLLPDRLSRVLIGRDLPARI